jgi:hypothetical protein
MDLLSQEPLGPQLRTGLLAYLAHFTGETGAALASGTWSNGSWNPEKAISIATKMQTGRLFIINPGIG